MAWPKGKPRPKGAGRVKGTPNKATMNAREAIAKLVDDNALLMQDWLNQIARENGPAAAWKCMTDVIEYHIPKLSRAELTGEGGKPMQVQVVRYTDTPAE